MKSAIGYINALQEIFVTLSKKKVNTLLAMGGVFLGVFILLFNTGIYNAFKDGDLTKSLNRGASAMQLRTDGNFDMEYDDVRKVKERFPSSKCFCVNLQAQTGIVTGDNNNRISSTLCILSPDYYNQMMLSTVFGRFIVDRDMEMKRKVCVLGKDVSRKLFGDGIDPCGRVLIINDVSFVIVGVVSKLFAGLAPFGNEKEMVFVPYTTADISFGLYGKTANLYVTLPHEIIKGQNRKDVENFIKQIHNADENGYEMDVMDSTEFISQWSDALIGLKVLTLIVGFGMIIAGLLNLFDITLNSIAERREEFGIKLCLGATPDFIRRSVMIEAMLISIAAGLAGAAFSAFATISIQRTIHIELVGRPSFSIPLCICVLIVMVAGGAIIGYLCIRDTVKQEVTTLLSKTE